MVLRYNDLCYVQLVSVSWNVTGRKVCCLWKAPNWNMLLSTGALLQWVQFPVSVIDCFMAPQMEIFNSIWLPRCMEIWKREWFLLFGTPMADCRWVWRDPRTRVTGRLDSVRLGWDKVKCMQEYVAASSENVRFTISITNKYARFTCFHLFCERTWRRFRVHALEADCWKTCAS